MRSVGALRGVSASDRAQSASEREGARNERVAEIFESTHPQSNGLRGVGDSKDIAVPSILNGR
jgi:hypothetical protein